MPDPGVGPYRYVATAGGEHAPWYVMPFDKHGRCRAPRTRGHLIDTISSGQFSDVFLFSHGWNNDWDTATDRYRDFMDGFTTMRTEHALDVRPGYKPLLVGIIWPGTALVMPWEAAPRFAGGAPVHEPTDDRSGDAQRMIDEIADELPDDAVPRFYELMDQDEGLDRSDALELAEMLLEFGSDGVLPDGGAPAAADLVAAWSEAQVAYPTRAAEEALFDDTEFGTVDAAAPGPHAAGFFDRIDPRKVIRLATVLQMKDRAGVVGIHGVSPLLRDILGACSSRVHLLGHSYGAKVVLSALSHGAVPRPVTSALLLQPAVSRFCFAADAGHGRPGGFRGALERTRLPIMSTFSRRDAPLSKFFHLAARRGSDVGEIRVAGGDISKYAALGGYGPGGLEDHEYVRVVIKPIGESYDLDARSEEVIALEAHDAIKGHGDISNTHTWWALYDSIAAT